MSGLSVQHPPNTDDDFTSSAFTVRWFHLDRPVHLEAEGKRLREGTREMGSALVDNRSSGVLPPTLPYKERVSIQYLISLARHRKELGSQQKTGCVPLEELDWN